MIYVRVRCTSCSRVLGEFDSYPADFEGKGAVQYCPKCSVPDSRDYVRVATGQGRDIPVMATFEWATMREHIERALATGKTVTLMLS